MSEWKRAIERAIELAANCARDAALLAEPAADEFERGWEKGALRAETDIRMLFLPENVMRWPMLIAQNDDPELLEWLAKANQMGGGFVSSLARAALVADHENYPLIRPLIVLMRAKYPKYEPSEEVKREIRERV